MWALPLRSHIRKTTHEKEEKTRKDKKGKIVPGAGEYGDDRGDGAVETLVLRFLRVLLKSSMLSSFPSYKGVLKHTHTHTHTHTITNTHTHTHIMRN